MKKLLTNIIACMAVQTAFAQFAPQAGVSGSTAISATSPVFTGWATSCRIDRGWKDINDTTQGYVSLGDSSAALGSPDFNIVSLGDRGRATMSFNSPLYDGPGADFAVFENGFQNGANPEEAFLELAFVEVSSDGANFTRFPATSNTYDSVQIPVAGVYMNARYIDNLAGKYIGGYGTPFDLQELAGTPGLDINHITHIRIVDVVGSVNANKSVDKNGHAINDPYPTPIAGGGFDLDAVGVIHMAGWFPVSVEGNNKPVVSIYPNPVADVLNINTVGKLKSIVLTDITGKVLYMTSDASGEMKLSMHSYPEGVYCLILVGANGTTWQERVIKY